MISLEEGGKRAEEPLVARLLPDVFEVREPRLQVNEVDRPIAEDLVGEVRRIERVRLSVSGISISTDRSWLEGRAYGVYRMPETHRLACTKERGGGLVECDRQLPTVCGCESEGSRCRTFWPRGVVIEALGRRIRQAMTAEEDIASVAGQLADLTRTVNEMNSQLKALSERTDAQQVRVNSQQDRTDVQQERIDLAARELAEVSDRLQAAANALRESI